MDRWRKQQTHQEETKAVKAALKQHGIAAQVGHGTGTAWGWLHIKVRCRPDTDYGIIRRQIIQIAQDATGRSGEYDGEINIYFKEGEQNEQTRSLQ